MAWGARVQDNSSRSRLQAWLTSACGGAVVLRHCMPQTWLLTRVVSPAQATGYLVMYGRGLKLAPTVRSNAPGTLALVTLGTRATLGVLSAHAGAQSGVHALARERATDDAAKT